jgi:hypothetical protein
MEQQSRSKTCPQCGGTFDPSRDRRAGFPAHGSSAAWDSGTLVAAALILMIALFVIPAIVDR